MPELIPPLKPRRSYGFLSFAVLAVVAVIALGAAWGALVAVERVSKSAVERALFLAGEDWAEVETNGLQVVLSGNAPSEAARFAALSAAGGEVDGARVIDQVVLPEAVAIEPPRFSIEMLRNQAGISLIGLIPAESDRDALTGEMRAIDPLQPVADFLKTAEHPTPEGWEEAVAFTLYATEMLPRSKISMDANHVLVEAIAGSPGQKEEWERALRREHPAGLRLALDIRAPHEVVSPFIVRFLSDDEGTRFDACTAHTEAGRNAIISAGIAAGVKGAVDCTIGLGVPSPDWPTAVARGIRAMRDMGGGSLTFSDADITLIAREGTPQDTFDRVTGELEADLPRVFSLHAVLPVPDTGAVAPAGPPEFIATLGNGGSVQLRGRVASEQDRSVVESLARARFGTRKVYAPLRLDPGLPASWAMRTLAGLEALDQLADGRVVVRPDVVTVTGSTGDRGASAEISRLLSEKLGDAQDFRVNVKYEEALDPIAAMPTPQECVADINAALARSKITFAPGSAEIERASLATVDRIAEILKTCPDVAMEIGGYTDSQGREEMNQALSQRRAEAVVSALLARRVLTTNLKAFGYGEDFPIADNDTEDGREANRRIEFKLVGETRARRETDPDGSDAPTIRPPSRPTDLGSEDSPEGPAPDEAGEAPEEPVDDAARETPEDAGEADGGATGAAEPATETAAETEDGVEPAPDPGAAADVSAEDGVAADAGADPEAADADPVPDADGTPDPVTAEAEPADTEGALAPADPPNETGATNHDAGTALPETETSTAEASEDTAPDPAPAEAPAVPETSDPEAAVDLAETDEDRAPVEAAGDGVDPDPALLDDPSSEDIPEEAVTADLDRLADGEGTVETGPETADQAAEGGASTPEMAADEPGATEPSDETGSPQSPDDAVEPDATDAPAETIALADLDETPAEADAAGETGEDSVEPSGTTETAEPADDTGAADPAADGDETVAATETPTIRPRPRPPLVVHPDLAGIRPRPRPADIPDAPSTE